MTRTATFHYMKDGAFLAARQLDTACDTAQEFADALANITRTGYCDQVQVWLGPGDGRRPDATAEVPS